jgi:predicted DNA-binding ArsR family transcriptional regulator
MYTIENLRKVIIITEMSDEEIKEALDYVNKMKKK